MENNDVNENPKVVSGTGSRRNSSMSELLQQLEERNRWGRYSIDWFWSAIKNKISNAFASKFKWFGGNQSKGLLGKSLNNLTKLIEYT